MKHFTTEEWIGFVNQVVSPSALDEIENHLKQGCKRCQEAVSAWQRVQKSAAAEKNYPPPAETLRIVKAAFADAGLQGQDKNPYETQDSHVGRDNPNASSSVPAA